MKSDREQALRAALHEMAYQMVSPTGETAIDRKTRYSGRSK